MYIFKILNALGYRITHILVGFALTVMSCFNHVRSLFYPNKILVETPYNGQKILLLALYEKGVLRNDIKNLLRQAKAKNLYVIGINTQKLLPGNFEGFFDCYIERYNFGRDFGSYKTGFQYVFKNKLHEQCARLLMINDSIFYESTRLPKFIDDLINTDREVFGATENFEVEYHIGSFCISIAGRILQHKKFMRYWNHFRNSDVRPTVIKRGEMGLSRCLKKLVVSPDHFCVLYSVAYMSNALQEYQVVEKVIKLVRRSDHLWARFDMFAIWIDFIKQYYLSQLELSLSKKSSLKFDKSWLTYTSVYDLMALKSFFETTLNIRDEQLLARMVRYFSAQLIWMFRQGSQIHQSNAILLSMGMPLIKLDGFFRGPVAEEDVLLICEQMESLEGFELRKLLFSKSYGGDTLIDWKILLFNHGFM